MYFSDRTHLMVLVNNDNTNLHVVPNCGKLMNFDKKKSKKSPLIKTRGPFCLVTNILKYIFSFGPQNKVWNNMKVNK